MKALFYADSNIFIVVYMPIVNVIIDNIIDITILVKGYNTTTTGTIIVNKDDSINKSNFISKLKQSIINLLS